MGTSVDGLLGYSCCRVLLHSDAICPIRIRMVRMCLSLFIAVCVFGYESRIIVHPEDFDIADIDSYKVKSKTVSFFNNAFYVHTDLFFKKKSRGNADIINADMSRNGNADITNADIPF